MNDRCHTCGGEVTAHVIGEDLATVVYRASPLAQAARALLDAATEFDNCFVPSNDMEWKLLQKLQDAIAKAQELPASTKGEPS